VVAHASGPAGTRAGVADVLYRLRAAAGQLEGLAVGYWDAIDTAARLPAREDQRPEVRLWVDYEGKFGMDDAAYAAAIARAAEEGRDVP
jgi:hypothetical protein